MATPRSGSYLLCEALTSTGLAGKPAEYFGPIELARHAREWQLTTYADFMARLIHEAATENGVFGAKVTWTHFSSLTTALAPEQPMSKSAQHQLVASVLPNLHYIWISRRDKLRQAVSYWKALQTGVWSSRSAHSAPLAQTAMFDFGAISELMARISTDEARIQRYFVESGISPFAVFYEDFVNDYERTTLAILRFLGIDQNLPLPLPKTNFLRQADDQTEDWIRRFRRAAGQES